MSDIERLLDEVIEATFMKRGFRPQTHREAILAALDDAGYAVLPKPADEISRLFEEARVAQLQEIEAAARGLLTDVRRRHPGEELSPHM